MCEVPWCEQGCDLYATIWSMVGWTDSEFPAKNLCACGLAIVACRQDQGVRVVTVECVTVGVGLPLTQCLVHIPTPC